MDDLAIYDTALSPQEIRGIMAHGVPEPSSMVLLVAGGLVGGVCLFVRGGRRLSRTGSVLARIFLLCLGALIVPTTSSAGEVGSPFVVASGGARFPDVAYNSVDGTYLAVWVDYSVQSVPVVRGRRVSNTGSSIGDGFRISEVATGGAYYPSVAYNAMDNEFLVSFDTDPTIYGQRVRGSDGAMVGGNFGIGVVDAGRSSVAWSPISNNYLVAYWAFPGGPTEIYGRRLTNTGSLIGNEFNISNDNRFSGYPSVAWGATDNQFLVAWDHEPVDNQGYIRGQRLSASDGSLLSGPFNIATSGTDNRSNIAYDSISNRWFVQYNLSNPGFSYDQFATFVNPDGSLASNSLPIAHTTGFEGDTLLGGDIAFTPGFDGRFFSVFERELGTLNGSTGQESSAAGSLIGPQLSLSSSGAGSIAVAADTNLHRFLTVWDGSASGVVQANLFTSKPIPEPSTFLLMALGGVVLWKTSFRRRR